MGDKILKKLLLVIGMFFAVTYAKVESSSVKTDANIQRYDKIFEQISKQRVGPSDKELSRIPTPFVNQNLLRIIKDKNATKPKPIVLKLYGIFDKKVKINKKWYHLKSKVYGYRIVKIKDNSVVLRKKRKKLELFLRKKNDKIQITKNF